MALTFCISVGENNILTSIVNHVTIHYITIGVSVIANIIVFLSEETGGQLEYILCHTGLNNRC